MHLAIIYSQSTKYNSLKTKYYYSAAAAVGVNAVHGGMVKGAEADGIRGEGGDTRQ